MSIQIEPTTSAASFDFSVADGAKKSFSGWGFSGADVVNLQILTHNGTYENYVDPTTGTAVTLSTSGNGVLVEGPFVGRWSKSTTGGSVGVREITL